jgi:long-chain acyl-CoA synthetase
MAETSTPWSLLDNYRGKTFQGEWPAVHTMFFITAERYAQRIAFSTFEKQQLRAYTYAQAAEYIKKTAAFLLKSGIKKNDAVVLTGANSIEWAISYLAIMTAGAVVVPLDHNMSGEKVAGIMRRVDAKMLICDHNKLEEGFNKAAVPGLSLTAGTKNYVLEAEAPLPDAFPESGESETAAILFTSGTTGAEKGVVLTHRSLVSDTYLVQSLITLRHDDIYYVLLPIHHAYCMTAVFLTCISVGAQLLFTDKMAISNILHDLKAGRVTLFLGIPMLFNKIIHGIMGGVRKKGLVVYGIVRMLMAVSGFFKKYMEVNIGKQLFKGLLKKASLSTMRIMISGGGPLAPRTFKLYNQLGIDFVQGYGLTETGPIITVNPVEKYKETSVGQVLPQTDIIILEPNEDCVGEIAVKGPMVFEGYYHDPAATAAVFTNNGYFKTGDLGWKDNENYIYITGRAKNIIVTEGGKNVYPEEVEDVFQLYPEFEQLLIRGYIADKEMQIEAIEAVVYPAEEFTKKHSRDEVKKRVVDIIREGNRRLAPYQQISRIRLTDKPLETTSAKKIKRFTTAEDEGEIIY